MLLTIFVVCLALGAVVGVLAGLLGIGGGLVIVPALVYLLLELGVEQNLAMPMALATSLATIILTATSASRAHHKNGNIPWHVARQLMVGIAIGAAVGALIADNSSSDALTKFFAVTVSLLAIYMMLAVKVSGEQPLPSKTKLLAIGLGTGILSSLMGIAGGSILVPVLTYYSLPVRHSIGVATICGVVVALFGTLTFVVAGIDQTGLPQWSLGYVYLPALIGIVCTSVFFAPIGVKLAARLPVALLKKCFAGFLLLVAIKMYFSV